METLAFGDTDGKIHNGGQSNKKPVMGFVNSILPSPTQLLVPAITVQGKQNYVDSGDNIEMATQRVKGVIYN